MPRVQLGFDFLREIIMIDYNEKYSLRDFTGEYLAEAADLIGITIYGSCFSHEIPDSKVFPDNMVGVTFVNCNLDNVAIPLGNTVIGGSRRRFKAQQDGYDYLIDINNLPLERL